MTDINRFLQDWCRFFWGQQFGNFAIIFFFFFNFYNLFNLQNVSHYQIFVYIFLTRKIFSNTKLFLLLCRLKDFFPVWNFSYNFSTYKISPVLNFFYYLSDSKIFYKTKFFIINNLCPRELLKKFLSTKFFILFSPFIKFSPVWNFLYYFSNLENCPPGSIFHTYYFLIESFLLHEDFVFFLPDF